VSGILEYPALRKTDKVYLSNIDKDRIVEIETEIQEIIGRENCPPVLKSKICKNCSYYDFCYVDEEFTELQNFQN
jgi:CRISPR-associated exonuclease Cas4